MIGQAGEDVGEPGTGVDVVELGGLDQGVDGGGSLGTDIGTSEGPVMAADGDAPQRAFGNVVGHAQAAVVEEADQGRPALQAVVDGLGGLALGGQPGALLAQPAFELGHQRSAALVTPAPAVFRREAIDLALDGEERIDAADGLDGDRRLLEPGKVEELPPRMGPAGGLDVICEQAFGEASGAYADPPNCVILLVPGNPL